MQMNTDNQSQMSTDSNRCSLPVARSPLKGLILVGGKSTRMQTDKAKLVYGDDPQMKICWDLLRLFCKETFLSCRIDQGDDDLYQHFEKIYDKQAYENIGPLGGILSAFDYDPYAPWLVLACDLPFVDESTLSDLVTQRNPDKIATAYKSAHDGLPEPLCAIYEPQAKDVLLKFFKDGSKCPRKILINSDVEMLDPKNKKALDNINTAEEYQVAKQR